MFYIETKYGNDGYATWIKLLRQLAVSNDHWINLSDQTELMFTSAKCKISQEKLIDIINDLSQMGEFNKILWEENKIIYSEKFMENIKDAYLRRKNKCIQFEDLCIQFKDLGIHNAYTSAINDIPNPHIIEYNTIPDNKIEYTTPFPETSSGKLESVDDFSFEEEETATTEPVHAEPKKEKKKNAGADAKPKKLPSVHALCIEVYNQWMIERTGLSAKIDGQEGAGMKAIIAYLKINSKDKSDEGVANSWRHILSLHSKWRPFEQGNLKISQINSNLINIINAIKNGNSKQQPTSLYELSKQCGNNLSDI